MNILARALVLVTLFGASGCEVSDTNTPQEETCRDGDMRDADDGCNTCECFAGDWACTGMACLPDPCEGVELPACPAACPDNFGVECGQPCDVEGETCGNEIGDGRTCQDGVWQCTVHPPLGMGCNRICNAAPA